MSTHPARSCESRVAALLAIIQLAAAPLAAQAGQMGPVGGRYARQAIMR
ncbi:MAG: hypothetical protein H0W15_11290 [Gemmatimonadales bacterium]|nr:hypothetical protein [Gemmatimonadales bacterium]